ncbi:hypothetical protein NDU88_003941 [Pleurodeles waltl]|uniref:Myb/SANT-like DNA-binding domain-containing protein n=1 Tax=Pleurodeles waltl TaxID=8319 RepID=A0AAV7T7T7_PLEWA|nr:hypothetical protein NDU88_003941 [Pleurodeles waltl]
MAHASGERAPAFTAQELEKLVDGVLPQYTLLYGPPDQQVSAHQKKDIWCAIAKDVRTLGVHQRQSTHCRKRWEDIRRWSKKTVEAQLGMASQRGRGARRTMTPLMFQILVVAYPELDGRLRASQQTQRASLGGGTVAPEHEGAASHMAMEGHTTDSEYTSGTEGEGSSTVVTGSATSDTDSSSDGSSLVCTGHQGSQCDTEPKHSQSPPVKHQKLDSARRDRGKTPAGKAAHKGPGGSVDSAVTPPKVGKGQKKASKSRKSSTAEKAAIIPAAQEATASPIVTGQDATDRVSVQEGSPIVTGQETTARVSAQEGSPIVTGQETTTRVSSQEGSPRPPPESVPRRAVPSSLVRRPPPESVPRRAPAATAPLGNERPPCKHRCTGQRQQSQAPLNRASTAEQGKDRHGKHR